MKIYSSLLLLALVLTACGNSSSQMPSVPESSVPALEDASFCTAPNQILLHHYSQTEDQNRYSYDLCFSEEKVELRVENVQRDAVISYLEQEYYLEDYSFEDLLAKINSYGLSVDPEAAYDGSDSCRFGDTLQVSLEDADPVVFSRIAPCFQDFEQVFEWQSNVQGDLDGLIQELNAVIPDLTEIIDANLNLPYPPAGIEATPQAENFLEKPFCAAEDSIQLSSYTRISGHDFLASYLCLSEGKVELLMTNTSRDIQVSYLRQEYYLEDYSFEEILNELKSLQIETTMEVSEVDISSMGACKSGNQVLITANGEKFNWHRISACGLKEGQMPDWHSNVEGDFEAAITIVQSLFQNLEDLSKMNYGMPYPPLKP